MNSYRGIYDGQCTCGCNDCRTHVSITLNAGTVAVTIEDGNGHETVEHMTPDELIARLAETPMLHVGDWGPACCSRYLSAEIDPPSMVTERLRAALDD